MTAVLALAGCGPRLEIAIQAEGMAAAGVIALSGPTPRSDMIMAAVDLALTAAHVDLHDVSVVVVTRGPGSFTGVRVTLATAQGLVSSLGIAGVGVPSLLAQAARTATSPCLAVQPARRAVVYAQTFVRRDDTPVPLDEPVIRPLDSLADSPLPVAAPAGLVLPPETARAEAALTTAEALIGLYLQGTIPNEGPLVPLYFEPPSAVPPNRTAKPWPPSPRDS